jgi:hypothetical protein
MREYHVGEMNDDQLYYFLVDKNTRNVLQIEYPSDIDEFNKILGTSEGKGNLLKDLGIILNNNSKVFENPMEITHNKSTVKKTEVRTEAVTEVTSEVAKKKATTKKKPSAKATAKKKSEIKPSTVYSVNLFGGLFD